MSQAIRQGEISASCTLRIWNTHAVIEVSERRTVGASRKIAQLARRLVQEEEVEEEVTDQSPRSKVKSGDGGARHRPGGEPACLASISRPCAAAPRAARRCDRSPRRR